MALQEQPYSFVFKKFVCVVAVRDQKLGQEIERALEQIPLVRVAVCDSCKSAEQAIKAQKRVHCCICGSGMKDMKSDELYLLKQFGDHIPFVMYLSKDSAELTAECKDFDAAAVLVQERCAPHSRKFVLSVCNQTIWGVLFPMQSLRINSALLHSLTVMFQNHPETVDGWAQQSSLSGRYLCSLWTTRCGFNTNQALICFKIMCAAFTHYLNEYLDQCHRNTTRASRKTRHCISRKYTDHQETVEYIMFRKRNYENLPIRTRDLVEFYDTITVGSGSSFKRRRV
ncbi:MAG: hypothetical protein JW768_02305 [Chitinispirillaceae bacterium]|nr:hypothetical protein [Chitinispirillaceae bacterium]